MSQSLRNNGAESRSVHTGAGCVATTIWVGPDGCDSGQSSDDMQEDDNELRRE